MGKYCRLIVPAQISALRALSHRSFLLFFIGVSIATTGQFMQSLAVPFYMNEVTDSNAWVGSSAFAVLIPSLFMTPVAGIWSDRISRKAILFGSFFTQLACSAAFLVLFAADLLTPWLIIGLQVVVGVASGFQWAPTQAMTALLVPPEDLLSAVRFVSLSFTAGRALGPALAGLTLLYWGPGPAFAVTIVAFALGLALMAPMKLRPAEPVKQEPFLLQFRHGLEYVRRRPAMRLAMVTSFIVACVGAVFAFALVASVADDVVSFGDASLGWLTATFGFGSLVVGLYVTRHGDRHLRSRVEMAAVGVYAVGVLLVGFSPWVAFGLLGYFVFGAAHMAHGVTMNSALQVQVDEQYRGRVMSVWLMSVLSGLPIGSLIGGFLGDLVSMRFVLLLYGGLLAVFWAITVVRSNGFASLDLGSD
ncbi:MAG: MFS transporter [Acidimicrobiia bacterium]|nr:MFS transporter [Acidimicrobiia bacterium]MYJ32654.1 MFS transporter [Acidimicrobiia bacterium]